MVLNTPMLIAAAILVASYALIFSERLHRTSAALLGAVVMVGVGEPASRVSLVIPCGGSCRRTDSLLGD